MKKIRKALTFNDVLLIPHYSEVLPKSVSLETNLTKNIKLDIPFISAAMDTVTDAKMAIEMAKLGGIGVIHKNMDEESQISEIKKVKSVDLIDLEVPNRALTDDDGILLVAAAIGVGMIERAKNLIEAGANVLVLDSAHGHSKGILDTVKSIKSELSKSKLNADIIVGNIANYKAIKDLVEAGADAVKVGIGPGSICTTRIVSGVGFPQFSAIQECAEEAKKYGIPVIADGGIKYSGDVAKALAAGASSVMMGSVLAKAEEAPGKIIEKDGVKYKYYRGMGSIGAMTKGSSDRYFQEGTAKEKLVPEGVESMVKLGGTVESILFQFVGGLRSSMGYLGSKDISTFWDHAEFVEISASGLAESHVHDVTIIKESPNY